MAERFVYVVMGTTGEYDDRNEWPVRAWPSEDEAQVHVYMADQKLKDAGCHPENEADPQTGSIRDKADAFQLEWSKSPKLKALLGEAFYIDYTGTRFYYHKVPMGGKF